MPRIFKFRDSKVIKATVYGVTRFMTVEEFVSRTIEAHKMRFHNPTYRSDLPQRVQYVDRSEIEQYTLWNDRG